MQLQVVYCVYLLKLSKLHYKDFSFYCVKDSEYKGKLKLVAETLCGSDEMLSYVTVPEYDYWLYG